MVPPMTQHLSQQGGQVLTAKPVLMAAGVWVLTVIIVMFGIPALGLDEAPGRLLWFGVVVATPVAAVVGKRNVKYGQPVQNAGPLPLAYTPQGEPIYPVVGYTPDGRPITADQAIGYRPANNRTNTLSVISIVACWFLPMVAIPLGHIALAQIDRTGEQGRGLAITGLVIGYLGLAVFAVVNCIWWLATA
jgi:hypothetical protein